MTETSEPTDAADETSEAEPRAATAPAGTADLEERLSGANGLVVGLDFDGTLSPIAEDPDAVTIQPASRRAVSTIAARQDAVVAVISGRSLDDLRARVGVDGVVYVGNHGFEMVRDGRRSVHPEAEALRPTVARACSAVEDRVDEVPGCVVERKGPTATVHHRRTPPDRLREVRAAVEAAIGGEDGLRLVSGKQAMEIRPDVDWDEGSAMRRIVEDAPDGWRAVYVGDSTTDEGVFRALEPDGVGVRIGVHVDTAAGVALPDQDAVAPFLDWLDEGILGGEQ